MIAPLLMAALLLGAGPRFTKEDAARLAKKEVLVKRIPPTGGDGMAAKAAGLVDAPPEVVWTIVNDCDHFFEFMPRTKKSQSSDEGRACRVEVSMPFPLSDLWSKTRVIKTFLDDGGRKRSWMLIEGTYDHVNGSWTVLPWDSGKKTLLLYTIDVSPNIPIPDGILQSLSEGAIPDTFEAVRARARSGVTKP